MNDGNGYKFKLCESKAFVNVLVHICRDSPSILWNQEATAKLHKR